MTVSSTDILRGFASGASAAAGAHAFNKAVEVAKKIDSYNVEKNPIPKDRDNKPLTDADGHMKVPFSPLEQTLICGGIAASIAGAPITASVAGGAGVAAYGSRVAQNSENCAVQ
ncbi:MAG TPA: hypothetical protein VLE95_04865 [Chlamydiales bacterium]|nr:hypothetical protein [Chlamydiales bacterium]